MARRFADESKLDDLPEVCLIGVLRDLVGRDVPKDTTIHVEVADHGATKRDLGSFFLTCKSFYQAFAGFLNPAGRTHMTPRYAVTLGIKSWPTPKVVVVEYGRHLQQLLRKPHRIIYVPELQATGILNGNKTVDEFLTLWASMSDIDRETVQGLNLSVPSATSIKALPRGVSNECFSFIQSRSIVPVHQDEIGVFTIEDRPIYDIDPEVVVVE